MSRRDSFLSCKIQNKSFVDEFEQFHRASFGSLLFLMPFTVSKKYLS
jgi:hypothetical protein